MQSQIIYKKEILIVISWLKKTCWFPVKNADGNRTQWVSHMFFGSCLTKV